MAKYTKKQIADAIKVLAADHLCLVHAIAVIEAGGVSSCMVAAQTPMGNGFLYTTKTLPRFIRGMVRKSLTRLTAEEKAERE